MRSIPAKTLERRTAGKRRSPRAQKTRRFLAARERRRTRQIAQALRRYPSLRHLYEAVEHAIKQQREDDDDDRSNDRSRGAAGEVEELERFDVGVDAEQLGGARRPAAGNGPHDVEGSERVDRADHDA